jgi:hypothetical protein
MMKIIDHIKRRDEIANLTSAIYGLHGISVIRCTMVDRRHIREVANVKPCLGDGIVARRLALQKPLSRCAWRTHRIRGSGAMSLWRVNHFC